MRLIKYTTMISALFCILSSPVQADAWTTIYPSDFVHIPTPPVVSPVTWNAEGMSNGFFSSDILDGTQGAQHLLGELPFPEIGDSFPVAVNCVFHDYYNSPNQSGLTSAQIAASAAQEFWKIDTDGYGLMGSDTFDIDAPSDLSSLFQIGPLYKTCGPWQMTNGNCNGSTTNAPAEQTSFDWNAYLPEGNTMDFSSYFLQIPVRPICDPGTSCLGGLTFEMCRIKWVKNYNYNPICVSNPCDENATCSSDGQTTYCECNEGYEGDGFTCEPIAPTDCNPNPCLNGGLCTDLSGEGTYSCECPEGFSGDNCETEDPQIEYPTEQVIELVDGWNLISTYMAPADPNFVQVLLGLEGVSSVDQLSTYITIAKNNLGQAYLPEWDFNGIGDWLDGQGYQVKTTQAINLIVTGVYLMPEDNPIALVAGWNMIGYLRIEPASAAAIFAEINAADNLVIIKNNLGQAYLPEWDFNGIGDMEPGQGYQVKVNEPDVLLYNANDDPY
jgi:hypothetical protein